MNGERQGLALLLREGMASWAAAWACTSNCSEQTTSTDAVASEMPVSVESSALVQLLTTMALSTIQEVQNEIGVTHEDHCQSSQA